MARACLIVAFLAVLAFPLDASGHGMRSAYVELEEQDAGAVVRSRTTVEAPSFRFRIDGCSIESLPGRSETDSGRVATAIARCGGGLAGRTIRFDELGGDIEEVSVWVRSSDGVTTSMLVLPGTPFAVIPARQTPLGVARAYVALGLQHIASGIDHLLFLVLLVLQLRRVRPVLVAETAFSLSHGAAFAVTALGLVRVNPAPAEACIALSLLLVALDVRRDAPVRTAGAAGIALVFGVVHGLGFAGGLREIGLPETHVAMALVGFGVGVEVGQLVVVGTLLALLYWLKGARWADRGQTAVLYVSGTLATYWLFARVLQLVVTEVGS